MLAREIMSDGVMSVSSDASVLEAAKLLINCHVSAMPVVDDSGHMVGIISEADIVDPKAAEKIRMAAGADGKPAQPGVASGFKVTEIMTRNVISAAETTPVTELARLMTLHKVKRLPIVRDDAVVGMVSRVDLLRALLAATGADPARISAERDDELRKEVAAACHGRSWSRARQLDIVVSGGVAHLWGVAPSDPVRRAYRAAAENVPGIKSVEVHMHVVPPAPTRIGL